MLSYCDMHATSPAPHYLPSRYYALVCLRLQELGVDVPGLLADCGIRAEILYAPDGQLTPQQVQDFTELGAARAHRSDLGFELGRLLKLSSHDILGYALLSAPTVDAALRLVARYFSLITPTYQMRYCVDAQGAEAVFTPKLSLSPTVLDFHLEAIVVAFHEHVRSLLGAPHLHSQLSLPMARPAHAARYAELIGAKIHFGEEPPATAKARIPMELLGRTLAMADAHALNMAESRCAGLLSRITQSASLASWTTMMLTQAADGAHSLKELASILNLSPRTFERRLAAEGVHFRALAQQALHERACALLKAPRSSVTQVAYQLGYGDVANFTRAFKRMAGVTPSQFQQDAAPTVDIPTGMP